MKKIMIILLLGSSMVGFSQNEGKQKRMLEDFSPEQHAILQTKKMALELDLNDNQQKQMLDLNKKWAELRSKKKAEMKALNKAEMTSTEKFNHMNAMLDEKLNRQTAVKRILNEDQYKTWKKSEYKMRHRSKEKYDRSGRSGAQHRKGRNG